MQGAFPEQTPPPPSRRSAVVRGSFCLPDPLIPAPAPVLWLLTTPCSVFQGNDQVRFELTCYSLAPQIKVRCCPPLGVGAGS